MAGTHPEEVTGTINASLWNSLDNGTWTFRFYTNDSKGDLGFKDLILNVYKPSPISTNNWWNTSYRYRKPIHVTNMLTYSLPQGYSVNISVDTASLVSSGKLRIDGNDLRIVYYNSASYTWLELDRINETNFNTGTTQIWFKTKESIIPSITVGNYYMYYGNEYANYPPTNKSKVYDFYDDFTQD